MLRNAMHGFILVVSVFLTGAAFAGEAPTMQQVYDAAKAGRLNDAQSMMQQVLKEHPNSAKAHFVDAEILAKMGRLPEARDELRAAERLQPGLTDEKPEAVQKLKSFLGEAHASLTPASANQPSQASFPWGWLILGIAAIVVIAFIMRLFAQPSVTAAPYPGNYPGNNYPGSYPPGMPPAGGGYGVPPVAPGMGSGILSGLATGAAVGAGMVAGEALAHRLIDGDHGNANAAQPMADASYTQAAPDTRSYDMGGNDFGVNDASSWDDSSTVADSSSSGDDWT